MSLATDGSRQAAAWFDTRDGNAEIYARWITAPGSDLDSDIRLTNTPADSFVPSLELVGSDLVAAWFEKPTSGPSTVELGRWTESGSLRWQRRLTLDHTAGRNPLLLRDGGRLFVAWIAARNGQADEIFGQWLDLDGTLLGTPRVLGTASEETWNLNGAVTADGSVLVLYDARLDTAAYEIYVSRLDGDASDSWRLTADDGFDSKYPDVAIGPRAFLLSWQDERDGNTEVYLSSASLDAIGSPVDSGARRITVTPGQSIGAYVAAGSGGFGLAWCDDSGGDHDLYFKSFDLDGRASGGTIRVYVAGSNSLIPSIIAAGRGYAIAWNELTPGSAGYHSADSRSEIMFATVNP